MLALKERPVKFSEMIGHKTTKKTLQTAFKNNSVPQVMFFLGKSGTGKTTASFIISALLNCNNPIDNEPCGECPACKDVFEEKFNRDVIRLNGGDIGKDEVNDLKNKVSYAPMYDKNKVVILEEGHLISKNGKEQALLLLEKPRKNLYFIIVSTESNKFPKTVKDRGQVFDFNNINEDIIFEYLVSLIDKYDDGNIPESFISGISLIANSCDNSVRKAVADFDRCMMGELWTPEQIEKELGYMSEKRMYEIFNLLVDKNKEFFNEINSLDIEKFFYYCWKIITNSRITGVSKDSDDPDLNFQEKSAFFKYLKSDNFKLLISIFRNIFKDCTNYFNKNIFYNYIIDYFEKSSIPVMKITERKVRKTR